MLLSWMVFIMLAAIAGNFVGYFTGKKFGDYLLQRRDTWIYKKEHLRKAEEFYHKRGGGAIVLARFLPIVRTFAPIIAGIVKMDIKKFALYNILGAVIWVGTLMTAGYLLGENAWVKRNLEYVILGIVLLATAPVLVNAFTGKKKPALQK